jgi:Uma2 family endonuclease
MAIAPHQPEMSLEEFLAWEAAQSTKHEFVDGEIYAMAGASRAHGTIALNLAALIRPAIRKSGCQAYLADMKVIPPAQRSVRYPDLVLTCDPRDLEDEQITRFPKLIVEVLSRGTASVDRGQKFEEYRRIPTLEEYVLIDSTQVLVEVLRRGNDLWTFTEYGPGASFRLESIPLDVRVNDLYEDIELGRLEQGVIDTVNRNRG